MKKLLLLCTAFLMLIFFAGCESGQVTQDQLKSLENVKEFPGLKKDYLYNKSLTFVARTYNSANAVIQMRNPETGEIICRGVGEFKNAIGMPFWFDYTFLIDARDGRIRTRFEGISGKQVGNSQGFNAGYYWKDISATLEKLRTEYYASIASSKKDDNW